MCARLDPTEQSRGNDPAPFAVTQSSDWCGGWNGAVHLDDPARTSDRGAGGISQPLVFDRGQGNLSDIADLSHDCAHPGRLTGDSGWGGTDWGGAAAEPALPPPSNGGG